MDDLRADNLRKDETIQKLTAELKASSPRKYVYDAVLGEGGPKIFRWSLGSLKKRREEALERNRVEYENRVGISNVNESSQSDNGCDEIDGSRLKN